MLDVRRIVTIVIVVFGSVCLSDLVADAQVVRLIDHNRVTFISGDKSERTNDLTPFISDIQHESELWEDRCASLPPGSHPCRYDPIWLATGRSRATQNSTLSGSLFVFEGTAYAYVTGFVSYDAFAISMAAIKFQVSAPTKMRILGTYEMSARAHYDFAIARTRLLLDGPEGRVIDERPRCNDTDMIDDPCPEGPVEVRRVVALSPGEYVLNIEAKAEVRRVTGNTMESSVSLNFMVAFVGSQVTLEQTPWSTVKQLYR